MGQRLQPLWTARDRDTTDSLAFVQVISGGTTSIAAGGFHSMVLKQGGSVWATGSNKDGQFGDGRTDSTSNFIRLAPCCDGTHTNSSCAVNRWMCHVHVFGRMFIVLLSAQMSQNWLVVAMLTFSLQPSVLIVNCIALSPNVYKVS